MRQEIVQFRCTPEERALIRAAADRHEMTVSEWARVAVLGVSGQENKSMVWQARSETGEIWRGIVSVVPDESPVESDGKP